MEKTPVHIVLMSVLMAFYLSINTIIITIYPSAEGGINSEGLLGLFYAGSAFMLLVLSALNGHMAFRRVSPYSLILSLVLIFMYQYTNNYIGTPRTPFLNYLLFSVVSFLLPCFIRIDVRVFLKAIMLFSLPAFFRIGQIFVPMISATEAITMGYSYSFLTSIIVSIVYIIYFFKNESAFSKVLTIICFIANMVYAFFLIAYGSRGPVISIIFLLGLMSVFRVNTTSKGVTIAKGKFTAILIVGLIVALFYIPLLSFLQSALSLWDLHLNFIDKFIAMSVAQDVSSGRDVIYELTSSTILQRPIFGYGIDQFENNTGIVYPHNFILQLLYDGGLILTSIVLIPVIRGVIKLFKVCTYNEFVLTIALFFASVPGGLLSGDLWTMVTLWVLFGSILSKQIVYQH